MCSAPLSFVWAHISNPCVITKWGEKENRKHFCNLNELRAGFEAIVAGAVLTTQFTQKGNNRFDKIITSDLCAVYAQNGFRIQLHACICAA